MPVGDSDGNWFKDEFEMLANQQPYTKFEEDEAFRASLVPITEPMDTYDNALEELLKEYKSKLPLEPIRSP